MRKKSAIAVVALLAGALMLPNHEALARGGGGGGHGGGFGGGGFHVVWQAVSTAVVSATGSAEVASASTDFAAEVSCRAARSGS